MNQYRVFLKNEEATLQWGAQLAKTLPNACIVYLQGDLGAGKTTLIRGVLQALGYTQHVKSPTYALVETYQLSDKTLYHFDLYRLNDPKELQYMGIEDYFSSETLSFIEWPERGVGFLPAADLKIQFIYESRGRTIVCNAYNPIGEHILSSFISCGKI